MAKPRPGYRIYRIKFCGYPFAVYLGNKRISQFPSITSALSAYPTAIFKRSNVVIKPYVKTLVC